MDTSEHGLSHPFKGLGAVANSLTGRPEGFLWINMSENQNFSTTSSEQNPHRILTISSIRFMLHIKKNVFIALNKVDFHNGPKWLIVGFSPQLMVKASEH